MTSYALVALSVSYLTLGVANTPAAQRLWWPYAIVVLIVAALDLRKDHRERHRGRRRQP